MYGKTDEHYTDRYQHYAGRQTGRMARLSGVPKLDPTQNGQLYKEQKYAEHCAESPGYLYVEVHLLVRGLIHLKGTVITMRGQTSKSFVTQLTAANP